MKRTPLSTLTSKLLVAVLTLLGLNSCHTKKTDTDEQRQRQQIDEYEREGRAVCLYGGPNMRFEKIQEAPIEKAPEGPATETQQANPDSL